MGSLKKLHWAVVWRSWRATPRSYIENLHRAFTGRHWVYRLPFCDSEERVDCFDESGVWIWLKIVIMTPIMRPPKPLNEPIQRPLRLLEVRSTLIQIWPIQAIMHSNKLRCARIQMRRFEWITRHGEIKQMKLLRLIWPVVASRSDILIESLN